MKTVDSTESMRCDIMELMIRRTAQLLGPIFHPLWPRLPHRGTRKPVTDTRSCAVRRRLMRSLWTREQAEENVEKASD